MWNLRTAAEPQSSQPFEGGPQGPFWQTPAPRENLAPICQAAERDGNRPDPLLRYLTRVPATYRSQQLRSGIQAAI